MNISSAEECSLDQGRGTCLASGLQDLDREGEKHVRTSVSRHGPKTSSHEFCPSLEKKRVNQLRIGIIWWKF